MLPCAAGAPRNISECRIGAGSLALLSHAAPRKLPSSTGDPSVVITSWCDGALSLQIRTPFERAHAEFTLVPAISAKLWISDLPAPSRSKRRTNDRGNLPFQTTRRDLSDRRNGKAFLGFGTVHQRGAARIVVCRRGTGVFRIDARNIWTFGREPVDFAEFSRRPAASEDDGGGRSRRPLHPCPGNLLGDGQVRRDACGCARLFFSTLGGRTGHVGRDACHARSEGEPGFGSFAAAENEPNRTRPRRSGHPSGAKYEEGRIDSAPARCHVAERPGISVDEGFEAPGGRSSPPPIGRRGRVFGDTRRNGLTRSTEFIHSNASPASRVKWTRR